MKLPSLDSLLKKATDTLSRFPLALAFTFIGAAYAIISIQTSDYKSETPHYYFNIIMSSYLGMLLFISIAIGIERRVFSQLNKILLKVGGIAFVVLYYFSLPDAFLEISSIRFFLYSLALHLLIAFVPFTSSGELNGFWQYNKNLFLRILTSGLYSGVLFIGLALAILAVDNLFKVHIDGKIYGYLWICIGGIFNTWFFLAGFPSEFQTLETKTDYPKGLKIFTQYVLLPLITVYLFILYAYMFKIIINAEWPIGWVSYLVLGFSVAGILSLLLVYPVRNDEGNKWMLIFSRFFYFALYPLIVLLFFAILRRIRDYGITEHRYFVMLLALWLLFIATYFLISKTKNIKLIPISLCIIAFASSFGPWGAFSVSLNSQKKHLSELLLKNKMLSNGKFVKSTTKISYDDHQEISSVIKYLVEMHGYQILQPFFTQNLDSVIKPSSNKSERHSYMQVNKIDSLMNILYEYSVDRENTYFNYQSENTGLIAIKDYDYFIQEFNSSNYYGQDTISLTYIFQDKKVTACLNKIKNQLSVSTDECGTILFDLKALTKSIKEKKYTDDTHIDLDAMTLTTSNDKVSIKIFIRNIGGNNDKGKIEINQLEAAILLKFK